MLDIKRKLALASLLFFSTPSYAEVYGCIDAEGYTQIHTATTERLKDTLIVSLSVDAPKGIEITSKALRGVLEVRLYGSYINQDHIQVSPNVSLLEYSGFTLLKVVGGKRVHHVKVEGSNILKITVGV